MTFFPKTSYMFQKELENQTDFLLSAAVRKCGNLEDAQDITQDTMLSALVYISKGNVINDLRGWLLTVLNRTYYAMLRKKYKMATVTIGQDFDIADEKDHFETIGATDEAESVRRGIAYLSKLYREVVVRHYMNGESVEKIARELGIPEGTVKSRLSAGRERIKKEIDDMDNYVKQSYEPVKLYVSNSGDSSIKGEPGSLVNNDLIAQNLLYLAYEEPITETELSRAIGIPMAYVEPIIKRLVDGELMKRIGNKVYTDFMIATTEDERKHIPAQKQFVTENAELFMRSVKKGLEKIRAANYYGRFTENQRNSLEMYFMFKCFDSGIYTTFSKIYNATQIFPDRPNGGRWIAFGHVLSQNFKENDYLDVIGYGYAGERWTYLDNYLGAKSIGFHVFDPEGFCGKRYFNGSSGIDDDGLLKVLHLIESGVNPEDTGFNVELLKSMPILAECKILRYEGDKAIIDIPVISSGEWAEMRKIIDDTKNGLIEDITELFTEFIKGTKQEIPKHLTSVPLQKQYMNAHMSMPMAAIRVAMKEDIIHNGNYDDGVQCPYPMVYIIDK